jgi:C1A family cysteine protease
MAIIINGVKMGFGGRPEPPVPGASGFSDRLNLTPIAESDWRDRDLSEFCFDVQNQGSTSACTAFAVSSGISATRGRKDDEQVSLNPMDLFIQVSNNLSRGIALSDALHATEVRGVAAKGDGQRYKVIEYVSCPNVEEIATAVLKGYYVATAIYVGQDTFRTDPADPDAKIPDDPSASEGHSILVVGLKKINSQWYFKIQNSWSREWGKDGFAHVPITYWRRMHFTDGWAILETDEA